MNNEFQNISVFGLYGADELRSLDSVSKQYGISLTHKQLRLICTANERLLESAGGIELDSGIIPKLIYEFSNSPTMTDPDCENILCELLESFYYFKAECEECYSDEELLEIMHHYFDNVCHGEVTLLNDATIGDLTRRTNEDGQ